MSYSSFARVYDALMKNADYPVRAEYLCTLLRSYGINNGLLLDLACGTGSLSLELSKHGYEVIGTDASPEMLCEAQNKAQSEGLDILFLCQKMEETDLFGTVKAAVCTLDSLNHLNERWLLNETFRRLHLFVEPGGIVIFDVNSVYKHRKVLANNTFVYDEADVYCVWRNTLYRKSNTIAIDLDFFRKDGSVYRRFHESFCETAYSDEVLTDVVNDEGFSVLHRYAENSFDEPNANTERVVYVIRRNTNG